MVGLSRHTIRAWERRHQLHPSRTPSGQRRYTADDVALLLHVKRAVTQHRLSLKMAFGSAQGELSIPVLQAGAVGDGPFVPLRPTTDTSSPGIWRSAADLLPEMIVILDVDGYVAASNLAAAVALGVPRDRMVGRHLADLLDQTPAQPDVRVLLQRACVRRTTFELELRAISGIHRWAFDCRPFSYEDQPHLAVIATMAVSSPTGVLQ